MKPGDICYSDIDKGMILIVIKYCEYVPPPLWRRDDEPKDESHYLVYDTKNACIRKYWPDLGVW